MNFDRVGCQQISIKPLRQEAQPATAGEREAVEAVKKEACRFTVRAKPFFNCGP
jgi:hypothetical protein